MGIPKKILSIGVALIALATNAHGVGHGPVFGLATPTNVQGGWTLDVSTMERVGPLDSGVISRAMLSYGITEDFQMSVSGPAVFSSAPLPPGRVTAMMPATSDFEGIAAWRFRRRDNAVGSRIETTAYAGLIVPGFQRLPGMLGSLHRAPGALAMISTGYASRKRYLWAGIGAMTFAQSHGDRRPGVLVYNLVYGYRPPPLRKEYPHWDGRFFIETTGEISGKVQRGGIALPGTDGGRLFVGPTTLWLYKKYGIEGGIQFPVYQNTGPIFERERYRVAINFSYFF